MKSRVRHIPSKCKYVVDTKKGIFSSWEHTCDSYYSMTVEGYSDSIISMDIAKEWAIKTARSMLEDAIVWEGSSK